MGWEMQHRCHVFHVFHGLRRSSGATCPVCLEELGREPVPWGRTGGTDHPFGGELDESLESLET